MTNSIFAVPAHIRNVLVGGLLTLGLAACGADGSSSSTATTASLSRNMGVITRGSITPATTSTTTPPTTNTVVSTPPGTQTGTNTPPTQTASTGTTTLDWTPPTSNTDGSALTDLSGYNVYYGTSPDNLNQTVKLTNPGLSAYTLSNLTSGTWYFQVSAVSSSGVESFRTGVVSTTI